MTFYIAVCEVLKSRVLRSGHIQTRWYTIRREYWWGNSWGTSTRMSRETGSRKGKWKRPRCPTSGFGYQLGVNLFEFCYTAGLQKSKVPGRQRDYILYGRPKYLWALVGTFFVPSFWQIEFLRRFLSYSKICRTYHKALSILDARQLFQGMCTHGQLHP
jgi:hypothetical protein